MTEHVEIDGAEHRQLGTDDAGDKREEESQWLC